MPDHLEGFLWCLTALIESSPGDMRGKLVAGGAVLGAIARQQGVDPGCIFSLFLESYLEPPTKGVS